MTTTDRTEEPTMQTITTTRLRETLTYIAEIRSFGEKLEASYIIEITKAGDTLERVKMTNAIGMALDPSEHHDLIVGALENDGLAEQAESFQVDIQGRVYDRHQRDFVMRRMSRGGNHDALDVQAWDAAYLMADGFGPITREQAQAQCWDWSHVRDSSPAAIADIAEALGYDAKPTPSDERTLTITKAQHDLLVEATQRMLASETHLVEMYGMEGTGMPEEAKALQALLYHLTN